MEEKTEYATLVALRDFYMVCLRDSERFDNDLAAKVDLITQCMKYDGFYEVVKRDEL